MTACRNESVSRVKCAGKGRVRQHIAVHIVRYGAAVEDDKSVVSVILEAAVRRRGDITRRIVSEGFARNYGIVTELLDSFRCDTI